MNIKEIKELMSEFDESGLSKVTITKKDFAMEMEKATGVVAAPPQAVAAPVAAPVATPTVAVEASEAPKAISGDTINSPMVGTFYEKPSPDSAPFVKVGDVVKKGQTLAIIEAMKIMNEIEAEFDCKILEVLAKDSQPVEFDMPLFAVEKM